MASIKNPEIKSIFAAYPKQARKPMKLLRDWIHEVASEHDMSVEEAIKWGEPSYRSDHGSPVRLGVRSDNELLCCIFFNCQTSLVETFRELYADELTFDGKRALTLKADSEFPEDTVKHCLEMALKYHQLKHLPQLGA